MTMPSTDYALVDILQILQHHSKTKSNQAQFILTLLYFILNCKDDQEKNQTYPIVDTFLTHF